MKATTSNTLIALLQELMTYIYTKKETGWGRITSILFRCLQEKDIPRILMRDKVFSCVFSMLHIDEVIKIFVALETTIFSMSNLEIGRRSVFKVVWCFFEMKRVIMDEVVGIRMDL